MRCRPLIALIVALAVPPLAAQSIGRGQALYTQLGCQASNCHGVNPAANLNNVMNGAASAATIEYAATFRSEMNYLVATFQTDAQASVDLAAWLATVVPQPPPPGPPAVTLTEYFHAEFGHYFVTYLAHEIAALDGGRIGGWTRTGRTFNAFASAGDDVVATCRFFTTRFAPKSSHFYTPLAIECDGLRKGDDWQYEGDAFYVRLADAGGCPADLVPVYRLYNNGQGGAANHRYTIDLAVHAEMIGKGWVPEGYGPQGVAFCVPS